MYYHFIILYYLLLIFLKMKDKKEKIFKNKQNIQPKEKNFKKRSEMEKELNIQRNKRNKGKAPNISDIEINHLNYYNEIAKQNTHGIMNNPSFKEIIRITKDESCLDHIKSKLLSKELAEVLDNMPLIRVERINYKNLEIGQMRQKLQTNYNSGVDKEKGKKFASNVFAKRLKQGGKYVPIKPIDDLYDKKDKLPNKGKKDLIKKNKLFVTINNNFWTKKNKNINERSKKINNEKEEVKNEVNDNKTKVIYKSDFGNKIKSLSFYKKNFNSENKINKKLEHNWSPNVLRNEEKTSNEGKKTNIYNNENSKKLRIRSRNLYYSSNLDIHNNTTIGNKNNIKINVNKKLGNSVEKDLNTNKTVQKSLKKENNSLGFYSRVRINPRRFYKENAKI